MTIVQKAGAIILSQKNPALVALLYRMKHKDWSFPKGHIEKDESAAETMEREVLEEIGLSTRLVRNDLPPPLEYEHPNGEHVVIHMFLLQSENDSTLKTEFDGDRIIWVHYKQVAEKLSYHNLKRYFLSILSQIENAIIMVNPQTH